MTASSAFKIQQTEQAGWARLSILGELDLMTADAFRRRLRALKATNTNVSVDLSHLDFIDSAGIHALDDAIADTRGCTWRVEIEPRVSDKARRVLDLIKAAGARTQL
jgi:anti-anti-sigma factor